MYIFVGRLYVSVATSYLSTEQAYILNMYAFPEGTGSCLGVIISYPEVSCGFPPFLLVLGFH